MSTQQKLEVIIEGNTVKLEKSLTNVNQALNASKREAQALAKELSQSPNNQDLLLKRQEQIAQALSLSGEKAKMLRESMSKIDPSVDGKAFIRLQSQLSATERDSRRLSTQFDVLNKTIDRVSGSSANFKFDPGSGVKSFQNSLDGVESALSSIGGTKDLLNFKSENASVEEMSRKFTDIGKASELLTKKMSLLKSELSSVNIETDPKAFTKIQNEINKTAEQLRGLDDVKLSIPIDSDGFVSEVKNATDEASDYIADVPERGGKSFIGGLIGIARSGGGGFKKEFLSLIASTSDDTKGALGNVVEISKNVLVKGLALVGGLAGKALNTSLSTALQGSEAYIRAGLQTVLKSSTALVTSMLPNAFKGVGNAIFKTITTPFTMLGGFIKSSVGTIVQGSLLTIGNQITNFATSRIGGVFKSLEETSISAKSLTNVLKFANVDDSVIKKLTADMNEYAKVTSFGASEMNKIIASLVASNVEAKDAGDLSKNIANSYALLGDGSRNISDIGVIFGQINSATKLMTQDFNQLRDAGIGGALKQEIESTFPEIIQEFGSFSEAMAGSAISADMVNQAIANIGGSEAAKNAAMVPKTMRAAFETLEETIGQKLQGTFEAINQSGIDVIQELTDIVEEMDFTPAINKLMEMFNVVTKIAKALRGMAKQVDFKQLMAPLNDTAKTVEKMFSSFLKSNNFKSLTSSVSSSFKSILSTVLNGLNAVINVLSEINFGDILASGANKLKDIFSTIEGFFKSPGLQNFLVQIARVFSSVVLNMLSLFNTLASQVSQVLQRIGNSKELKVIGAFITNTIGSAVNAIGVTIGNVVDVLSKGGFVDNLVNAFSKLKDIFNIIFELLKSPAIANFSSNVLDVVSNWFLTTFDSAILLGSELSKLFETLDKFGVFIQLSEVLQQLFTTVVGGLAGVIEKLLKTLNGNDAMSILSSSLDGILRIIKAIDDALASDLINSTLAVIVETVLLLIDLISVTLAGAFESMVAAFEDIDLSPLIGPIEKFIEVFKSFFDNVFKVFMAEMDKIKSSGIFDEMNDSISRLSDTFSKLFENLKPVIDMLGELFGLLLGDTLKRAFEEFNTTLDFINDLASVINKVLEMFNAFKASDFYKISRIISKLFMGDIFGKNGLVSLIQDYSDVSPSGNYSSNSNLSTFGSVSTVNGGDTINHVQIDVQSSPGQSATELARMVRKQFDLGLA